MAEQKETTVRVHFEPPLVLPGTEHYAAAEINGEAHGPITFSSVGVSFFSGGIPCFAAWHSCNGVVGWQTEQEARAARKSSEAAK